MIVLHRWEIGDRVYRVSQPDLVGTVVNVLRYSCLVAVRPDGELDRVRIVPSADLEHWTRPEIGAHLTPAQRAIAWRLKALMDRER